MTRHVHRAVLTAVAVVTSALTAVLAVGATTEGAPADAPATEESAVAVSGLAAVVEGADAVPVDPVAAFVDRLRGQSEDAAAVAEDGVVRVILRRDPFQPVVPVKADASGSTDDGSQDAGDGDTADEDGGTDTGGATDGDTASADPACTGGTAETVCDGVVITLVSASEGSAVIQINEARYEVEDGGIFAESFRVISIDAPCVSLQYGDESFSVCEGATVLK